MSRSPIPRHRALLAGFCLAGALSAQAATQKKSSMRHWSAGIPRN